MFYTSHENNFLNEDNVSYLSTKFNYNIQQKMVEFSKNNKLDDFEYVNMDAFETLEYINKLFIDSEKKEVKDSIIITNKHPKYIIDNLQNRIDTDLPFMDISPPEDIFVSEKFRNSVKKRETYLYKRNYDVNENNFKDSLNSFDKKFNPLSKNKYISSESLFY